MAKAKLSKKFASHAVRQTSQIFAVFSMDLIDMGATASRYRYILVTLDDFSNFVSLANLRNKSAATAQRQLWEIFALFGPPQTLLTDRGREFINSLVKKFTEEAGIQHVVTYAYHAQGNGRNERSHQVINNTLRILSEHHPTQWYRYTKAVQYMMNCRPNIDTGISPYEVLFGRKPRSLTNVTPFLEYDHREAIKLRNAVDAMVLLHRQQRIKSTGKIAPESFKIGQKVKVVKHFPKRAKHRFPTLGPYTVMKKISTSGYLLKHDISGKTMETPSLWIQPLHTREEDGNLGTPSAEKSTQAKPTNSPTEDENENESDNEESSGYDEEQKETTETEEKEPQRKKPRLLARLQSHNEVPEPTDIEQEARVGAMIATKDGAGARIGEVRKDLGSDWEVQWYGSTTKKAFPRRRWKFYPGWETEDGEVIYRMSQVGTGRPALAQVGKDEVILSFTRLTLKATIPLQVLKNVETLQLS